MPAKPFSCLSCNGGQLVGGGGGDNVDVMLVVCGDDHG
jgi:hypothetical protein